jgi:cytochrome c553
MTQNELGGWIMKVISFQSALQVAILAIVFSLASRADGSGASAASRPRFQSKIDYCKDCHGPSGQGYHGYLIMPRLAGQTPEYIENQLRAFVERTREKALFINMARVHAVGPDIRTTLGMHFKSLNPPPFGAAPRHLVANGRQLYEEGAPEANVPACAACHGPRAEGEGPNPRLAGQLYPYTVKELTNWSKERKSGSSAVMEPIARALTQPQITALAAYFSSLR